MNTCSTEVRKISPDIAQKILESRHANRAISKPIVSKYAADMAMNQWMVTGEPLIFSEHGKLLDGQHRLSAVIVAKKDVEFLCVSGIPQEAFEKMGQGKKRTFADFLSISGYKNCTTLSSAITVLNKFRTQTFTSIGELVSFRLGEEILLKHPMLIESLKQRSCIPYFFKFKGAFIALHYIFGLVDKCKRDDFFHKLTSGVGLGFNDVELLLRDRLISELSKKNRLPDFEVVALTIRAFNARLMDKTIKCLKWSRTDPFPSIYGFDWKRL